MNQYFSEGKPLLFFLRITFLTYFFQQGQTHLRREQLARKQEKQLRWTQELLLMQEKEEFNKSLLEPLFLHLKTHLPRCEVEQIPTFVG